MEFGYVVSSSVFFTVTVVLVFATFDNVAVMWMLLFICLLLFSLLVFSSTSSPLAFSLCITIVPFSIKLVEITPTSDSTGPFPWLSVTLVFTW